MTIQLMLQPPSDVVWIDFKAFHLEVDGKACGVTIKGKEFSFFLLFPVLGRTNFILHHFTCR